MKKKVVLVTGASKGLGKKIAMTLAQKNYTVFSGVRNLQKSPPNTIPIWLDLTKEKSLQLCVKKIIDEAGTIDILINNAGIAYWGGVDTLTLKEAQELFNINFFGPFRLTQLVLPYMRKQRSGKILFISSIRAVESCAFMGMYSASKAALEAIALDWATTLQQWNISVLVAQPGPINTGIELKHGNYFPSNKSNPYLPYGKVSLPSQSIKEACDAILKGLENPLYTFKYQTNNFSKTIVSKHLKDPSAMEWYQQQKQFVNSKHVEKSKL